MSRQIAGEKNFTPPFFSLIDRFIIVACAVCLLFAVTIRPAYAEAKIYQGLSIEREGGATDESVVLKGNGKSQIHIVQGGRYRISGTWDAAAAGWTPAAEPEGILTVDTTDPVVITLNDVSMTAPSQNLQWYSVYGIGAVDDASVKLVLEGENRIDMSTVFGGRGTGAGAVSAGSRASLTISGGGSLLAKGGPSCPAIGAAKGAQGTNIAINGGRIEAYGGSRAAGIGGYGSSSGTIGDILIEEEDGQHVEIVVESGGGIGAAAIGGGSDSGYESITIRSGSVHALSPSINNKNWSYGAGIGGGGSSSRKPHVGPIVISGGNIYAESSAYGAGIGGGSGQESPDITLEGGTIVAVARRYGAGIGAGDGKGGTNARIVLSGDASVTAVSRNGQAIGVGDEALESESPQVVVGESASLRAFSGRELAVPRDTDVEAGSMLNLSFTEVLPRSMEIGPKGASEATELVLPDGTEGFVTSFACMMPVPERPVRVKNPADGTCAKTAADVFDFAPVAQEVLTETGMTWGMPPVDQFDVHVEVTGRGSVSPAGMLVDEGSDVSLQLLPDAGYEVKSVAVNDMQVQFGDTVEITSVDRDTIVEVEFGPIEYKIDYDLQGGAFLGPAPASYTVESESFPLPKPVREGFDFMGWTFAEGQSPEVDVVIGSGSMGDIAATSHWQKSEVPGEGNDSDGKPGDGGGIRPDDGDDAESGDGAPGGDLPSGDGGAPNGDAKPERLPVTSDRVSAGATGALVGAVALLSACARRVQRARR